MVYDRGAPRHDVGVSRATLRESVRQTPRTAPAMISIVKHEEFVSEHPADHWRDVDAMDAVVLDLGAGDFGMRQHKQYPSTVDWWLEGGAGEVIAVDMAGDDLTGYDERVVTIEANIQYSVELDELVLAHRPEIVKVDLEGAECLLAGMRSVAFRVPRLWLVEVHTAALYDQVMAAFDEFGYKVTVIRRHHHLEGVTVIYAEWRYRAND